MKLGWILLGGAALIGIGVVVFFKATEASAASSAAKGFAVADDCSTITVVDKAAAEDAMRAAAIVSFSSMDERAVDMLDRMLATMFPQCTPIADDTVVSVPGMVPMPMSALRLLLSFTTVGELKDKLESGELGLEGATTGGGARLSVRDFILGALAGGIQ
jgi:hypothetical protein